MSVQGSSPHTTPEPLEERAEALVRVIGPTGLSDVAAQLVKVEPGDKSLNVKALGTGSVGTGMSLDIWLPFTCDVRVRTSEEMADRQGGGGGGGGGEEQVGDAVASASSISSPTTAATTTTTTKSKPTTMTTSANVSLKALEGGSISVETVGGTASFQSVKAHPLEVTTIEGNVEAGSLTGDTRISTVTGSVIAKKIQAIDLAVITATGDVHIGALYGGTCHIGTVTGDVRLGSAHGDCSIGTETSSIFIGTAEGNLVARSAGGGDIDVHLVETNTAHVETKGGRVGISVGQGHEANAPFLTVNTGSVEASADFVVAAAEGNNVAWHVVPESGVNGISAAETLAAADEQLQKRKEDEEEEEEKEAGTPTHQVTAQHTDVRTRSFVENMTRVIAKKTPGM